ncbi:MAG TPA: hypothetical protein PK152_10190 [Anaerolineales bacterium]|nr:hypothetical protein [Anaerolineales bacterium]
MKRILFFSVLALLIAACGADAQTNEPAGSTELALAATATVEGPQAALESMTAPEETPLPDEINAPLIDSPSLINIEMLDEVYGWGITEENIVRTNDGGVTWYNVTPGNLADAGYLVHADFFDATHAWVQLPDMNNYPNGGTLYRTSDGGITWDAFETPFSGGSLHFITEENGWMMADLGVGAGSMAVSIFQTEDGGATWQRVYTNDPNLADAGVTLPLGGIKNILLPLDMQTAWVGGVVYAPGEMYLFRSQDGGETWLQINVVLPDEAAESELSVLGILFVSETDGLLALRMSAETPQTIIYATEDGGVTWSLLPVSFEGYGILETPSAREMIFYTDDQFYVTNDAGETIQQIAPEIAFGDSLIDMSFANSQTGWVIAASPSNERTLYKTTDGGETWTPLTP